MHNMYILYTYYIFLVHMYIAMCSASTTDQGTRLITVLFQSTKLDERTRPIIIYPSGFNGRGHELSLVIVGHSHGPGVPTWDMRISAS